MNSIPILNVHIHTTSYADATQRIINWAKAGESRMVCAANVHMVMEAHDQPGFKAILNKADLVTPDGMPLVWMLHKLGFKEQKRVYGPDLMLHVLAAAKDAGIPVGFYGAKPEVLKALLEKMRDQFPGLQIVYAYSPPFGAMQVSQTEKIMTNIRLAAPRILFVALGCPKQERWMAQHRGEIPSVMLGVGAAFDYFAGAKEQAPGWMQKIGLEWLFRLTREPKRLWKRYLINNPRFIWLAFLQLMRFRTYDKSV